MDDRAPQILLDYTPDEILARIGEQAKVAFQAELDFFVWRANNDPAPFDAFMEKYLEWVDCSERMLTATRVSRGNIRTSWRGSRRSLCRSGARYSGPTSKASLTLLYARCAGFFTLIQCAAAT
jgi:hypothetical protein